MQLFDSPASLKRGQTPGYSRSCARLVGGYMQFRTSTNVANCLGDAISTHHDAFDMASAACKLFGADAALAVAFSALDARLDGRDSDFRFWTSVFHTLTRD